MDAEMARGLLPGALALSAKFGPVVHRVAQRCLEALRQLAADPAAFSERRAHHPCIAAPMHHTDRADVSAWHGLHWARFGLVVNRWDRMQVSERVSEKVAAVRERVGVPDSHSTSNEHAVATGAVCCSCCRVPFLQHSTSWLTMAGNNVQDDCQASTSVSCCLPVAPAKGGPDRVVCRCCCAGGEMNGVSDSSVRKRRVGVVEMTERSEQSKGSTAL